MRYPASRRPEIIKLVEQSHLPAKRTLDKLGIPRATFTDGMIAIVTAGLLFTIAIVRAALKRWPTIAHDRTASGIASRTMSAARSSTWRWSSQSCRRASWPFGSPTSRSILSRRLRSIGC